MAKEIGKLLEASLEGVEAIVDTLSDNEFIKSIPIVGTVVKLITGSLELRDKIFVIKVSKFISALQNISETDRRAFERKIQQARESTTKVGETAILVLDKLNDLKKAELLGFYFVSFLRYTMKQRKLAESCTIAGMKNTNGSFNTDVSTEIMPELRRVRCVYLMATVTPH